VLFIARMKTVTLTAEAIKALKRHANMAARIIKAVNEYAASEGAHANRVIALKGSSAWRLRVGDYRVIFEETDTSITVTDLGPRGDIYD
jgi:mRNA interferase RelE/StbE